MTLDDLHEILTETGIPVRYRKFDQDDDPEFPCIVYYLNYDDNFSADNRRFFHAQNISVELYTDEKDEDAEHMLEDAAEANGVYLYLVDEYYWPDDRLHEVLYETTIY